MDQLHVLLGFATCPPRKQAISYEMKKVQRATHQVRIFEFFQYGNIDKFDVEKLVYGLKRPADRDVIFELDRYFMVDKRLEEALATLILACEYLP